MNSEPRISAGADISEPRTSARANAPVREHPLDLERVCAGTQQDRTKGGLPLRRRRRTPFARGSTDRAQCEAGSTRHEPIPADAAGVSPDDAVHPQDEAGNPPDEAGNPPDEAENPSDGAASAVAADPAEVSAGFPDDVGDGCVALDAAAVLKAKSRSFALRVRGCSMIGAGIEDGDIVVGEFTPSARAGAVVVALIDGQSTLKRFVTRGGRPCLVSENPNCPDPVAMSELVIQGVVHTVVKRIAVSC